MVDSMVLTKVDMLAWMLMVGWLVVLMVASTALKLVAQWAAQMVWKLEKPQVDQWVHQKG